MQRHKDPTHWFSFIKTAPFEDLVNTVNRQPKGTLLSLLEKDTEQNSIHAVVRLDSVTKGNKLLEFFLSKGAQLDHRDYLDQTPLFFAAQLGHKQQVQMLLSKGADADAVDAHGQTPLYYAAREGHLDVIKALVQRHAAVDAADKIGQTAMFYACREGRLEATQLLVAYGANVNQRDQNGRSPLYWAKRSRNRGLVKMLEAAGAVELPAKRAATAKKTEKRVQCQLMKVSAAGYKSPMTMEDFREFQARFPSVAKFFTNPETLAELDSMTQERLDALRPWEKSAKKLMKVLWCCDNAWIFHEPVDPVKLRIPDYFEYVTHPMDFGTIRRKLLNNAYRRCEDLIADFELVFRNCRAYNLPSSVVIKMCDAVEAVYEKQLRELSLEHFRPAFRP